MAGFRGAEPIEVAEPIEEAESIDEAAPIHTEPHIVVPGFTDWHVHTSLADPTQIGDSPIVRVLDLGANPQVVAELAANSKPEILFAGAFMTAEDGYPSDRSWAAPGSWRFVTNEAEANQHVAEMKALGASIIKVALNSATGPVPADAEIQAIVAAAAEHGLAVVAHAEGEGQAARARLLGANYLAHTPFTELLSDDEIQAQAESVGWISTLDIHGWGTPDVFFYIAVENLRRFAAAGGLVLYGTDMGNGPTPIGFNLRELEALQLAGLTEEQLITALTGPAPGIANAHQSLKTIIPGEPGSLRFSEAKPLR